MRHRPPLLRTVLFLGAAFAVAVVAILMFVRVDRIVVADGVFEGSSRAVRAPWVGVVRDVFVEPGARVEVGERIARLDTAALDAELEVVVARDGGLVAQRTSLEAELGRHTRALQPAERADLERGVERAQLVVDAARKREERFVALHEEGLVQVVEVEGAVLARKLAEVGLAAASAELETLPARQETDVSALEARLSELDHELVETRARRNELERMCEASVLVAPVAGRVHGRRAAELVGAGVHAGDEVLWIAVEGVERFVARVDDRGRTRVEPGLAAKLRLVGYPWLVHGTVPARVVGVADRADSGDGFAVALELDGDHGVGALYEGMTGTARIVTTERVPLLRLLVERVIGSTP